MQTDTRLPAQAHWIETPFGELFAQRWPVVEPKGAPIILLHDSLGCVALWRDFPQQLALHTQRDVIAYDRLGFGRSAPCQLRTPLGINFVADEAYAGFFWVHQYFQLTQFVLLGHSVGAGMALACASVHQGGCEAVIAEAAQAYVDDAITQGIRQTNAFFQTPERFARLTQYHGDKAHWVLNAWVSTWLSADFTHWQIQDTLSSVRCPVLCLHGEDDEYGAPCHAQTIVEGVAGPAFANILSNCGHVPHKEQCATVLQSIKFFLQQD